MLNVLIALSGNSYSTCPSLNRLECLTGIRRRTLQRTIRQMCNSKHLQTVPQFGRDGTQLTNLYEVTPLVNEVGDLHD